MQLRRGQRDHPEVQKKCPDFGKKGLDCIHLWVKFSIPNVVLGASKRKKSKMFLYRAFFYCFWRNALPSSKKPSLLSRNAGYALSHYYLCKMLHLKWLTVSWIRLCLNCSVICTVTLCYVLHQTRYMEPYSSQANWALLRRYLETLSKHIQAYSDIFGTLLHIHNLAISRTLIHLEPVAYSKPYETLIRHFEKPAIAGSVYLGIIQSYSKPCVRLAYLETWKYRTPA